MTAATYPLKLDAELDRAIRETARLTGLNLADTMRQSIAKGLPLLREALRRDEAPVTNVPPLPEAALRRYYARRTPEDRARRGAMLRFQIQETPE